MRSSTKLFVLFYSSLAIMHSFNAASAVGARRAGMAGKSSHFTSRVEFEAFCPSAIKNLTDWKSSLFRRTMELYKATEKKLGTLAEPSGHERFSLFSPFVSCSHKNALTRFGGQADGGKILCEDTVSSPECIVYSLGSNNDFSFEVDVLRRTTCQVITFDCTTNPANVDKKRHKFMPKCIGSERKMAANPSKWMTLDAAMRHFGHRSVSLLKIDIEASEYDVMSSWKHDSPYLPEQIAMELHYDGIYFGTPSYLNREDWGNLLWPMHKASLSDLSLFMSHLASMGYAIVSREDNAICDHCSELTLLRVAHICDV